MSDGNRLVAGDLVRIATAGGGGWGAPFDRPAESVRDDVLDGFVTPQSARDDYGVVLNEGAIDVAATRATRAELRRAPGAMFHRGGWFDGEVMDRGAD